MDGADGDQDYSQGNLFNHLNSSKPRCFYNRVSHNITVAR